MGSSPDMYVNLIKKAEITYKEVKEYTKSKTDDGLINLVWKKDIEIAKENIFYMIGYLECAIKGLKKDSDSRDKYNKWVDTFKELLIELKK